MDRLKYEFIVHPGADPAQIRLAYRGADVSLNQAGQLEVSTPLGGFADDAPVAYQEIDGRPVAVEVAYDLDDDDGRGDMDGGRRGDPAWSPRAGTQARPYAWSPWADTQVRPYGFRVGSYDPARPLVLDPAAIVCCGNVPESSASMPTPTDARMRITKANTLNATAVAISGTLAYAGFDSRLLVLDISDPIAPRSIAEIVLTLDDIQDITVQSDYLYVANNNGGLRIISVSAPASPVEVGYTTAITPVKSVAVLGNYAYVAGGNLGVISVTNPASPTLVGTYEVQWGWSYNVDVQNDYAYLTQNTLMVISVTTPASPTLVGSVSTFMPYYVDVAGDYAYLADYLQGLQVISVTVPTSPTIVGSVSTGSYDTRVVVSGTHAYVCASHYSLDGTGYLHVISVTNSTTPTLLGTLFLPGGCRDLALTDQYAYVANSNGLRIISTSDPQHPVEVGSYPPTPLDSVVINGLTVGVVNTAYTFTATVNPPTVTTPITYVWRATGQSPVTYTGDLSDTEAFTWDIPGIQVITVTATNAVGTVTGTHGITIRLGTMAAAVPGTADIWLAGQADGTELQSYNPSFPPDVASTNSPVERTPAVLPGSTLAVTAQGGVNHDPGSPLYPPDGEPNIWYAEGHFGLSGINAPLSSLVGVFLGPHAPDPILQPESLDFQDAAQRDFATLAPQLQQVFFIGDGRRSSGEYQYFTVPEGATRLFLGAMDAPGTNYNNGGEFFFHVDSEAMFSISGHVQDDSGKPISGVTVSAGAGGSAVTNAGGDYALTGLITGTYTLTPGKSGYSFAPASRTVSVPPNASGQDFTGIVVVPGAEQPPNELAPMSERAADRARGGDDDEVVVWSHAAIDSLVGFRQAYDSSAGSSPEVEIRIPRYYGATNNGMLTDQVISNVIQEARLVVCAWDLDPGENVQVRINGAYTLYPQGMDQDWRCYSYPLDENALRALRFPQRPGGASDPHGSDPVLPGMPAPASNWLTIVYPSDRKALIYGLRLIIQAVRPVVLVPGFGAEASEYNWGQIESTLNTQGVITERPCDYGWSYNLLTGWSPEPHHPRCFERVARLKSNTGTLETNSWALLYAVAEVRARYGVQKVNLVGHSKGGLFSRAYVSAAQYAGDVENLVSISSPQLGGYIQDVAMNKKDFPYCQAGILDFFCEFGRGELETAVWAVAELINFKPHFDDQAGIGSVPIKCW